MRSFGDIAERFSARMFKVAEAVFPGTNEVVGIRVLSELEMDNARLEAVRYMKARQVDAVVDRDTILDREIQRQIVWRAFVTENDQGEHVPFIGSDTQLRDSLDTATLDRLYETYLEHQRAILDDSLPSDEALDELAETLANRLSAAEALVRAMDSRSLRLLVGRMADRIATLSKAESA